MRSRALTVPFPQAESVRRSLRDHGWLRTDLIVGRAPTGVVFPLTEDAAPGAEDGTIDAWEFEELHARPSSYRELLHGFTSPELALLPRSFDVVGDIVLVRLPSELATRSREVGEALLAFVPGARKVGCDRGVHGVERRRELESLAGSGPWVTRHRENGLELEVDLGSAYFSPRLAHEHARIAAAVGPGERVFDLCCGVGPFALLIGRDARAREVVAVDVNPAAIDLLRRNAERLSVATRVRAVQGDLAEILPSIGVANRVILNLPHEGIKYLTSVGTSVERGGTLHYYEVTERAPAGERALQLVDRLGGAGGWRPGETRVVHPYSPTSDLLAFTFHRSSTE